ncbi:MAG: class D sortase [Peptostreptococcaceae bacterium]
MKSNKLFEFMKNNSRLLKKIGITFVIPLSLSITGALIFFSAGWNLLAETYMVGSTIFAQPNNNVGSVKFNINDKEVYRPDLGQQFGNLVIPDINLEKPMIHGDTSNDLKKGVGHYSGSTLPGESGNVVLSGHRETALKDLKDVKVGQSIILDTNWGVYEYKIKEINIVDKNAHHVLDPTDYEKLTLYTCYPFNYVGPAPERFVVTGEFVGIVD